MTKSTTWPVRPAKTQFSLDIRPDCLEFTVRFLLIAKDTRFLHADSDDQTGQMPMPIWDFAGRSCNFVGFVMRRLKCDYFLNNFIIVVWLYLNECNSHQKIFAKPDFGKLT